MADKSGFKLCGADIQLAAKVSPHGFRVDFQRAAEGDDPNAIIASLRPLSLRQSATPIVALLRAPAASEAFQQQLLPNLLPVGAINVDERR